MARELHSRKPVKYSCGLGSNKLKETVLNIDDEIRKLIATDKRKNYWSIEMTETLQKYYKEVSLKTLVKIFALKFPDVQITRDSLTSKARKMGYCSYV